MNNETPTNGELDVMFKGLKEHFGDKIESATRSLGKSIDEVRVQTTKTNGRVTRLEKWMWMCVGGGIVVMAIVIPLVIYVWNLGTNINQKVEAGVSSVLGQYEVQIK